MSVDKKGSRYCDECGRGIVKAHKVYKGNDYCGSCYARVFPSVPCSRCRKSARPHRNDIGDPVCKACLMSDRLCIRCEKSVPRAALLVDGKAVCSSCSPYFRSEQQCPGCNRVTSRLSAAPAYGVVDKVCDSCRNQLTHATCTICRKHRRVATFVDGQGARCTSCADNPSVAHPCPDCGDRVLGRGNSRCRPCANKLALDREVTLTSAIFRHEWAATLWVRFSLWLYSSHRANPNLLGLVRSHQIYFERIDAAFSSVLDLTDQSLLRLFGVTVLRTHLLPTRFMNEQLGIEISDEDKLDAVERSRIEEVILASKRESWGWIVQAYLAELDKKGLSLRSIRMYISTANQFAESVRLERQAWTAGQIERFLASWPARRNNLSGFVSFCQQSQKWDVTLPAKGAVIAPVRNPLAVVSKLTKLITKVDVTGIEQADKKVLEKILAAALGIPVRMVKAMSIDQINIEETGIVFSLAEKEVLLPPELEPYGRRLASYLA